MKKEDKWEMPETALVYERSMMQESVNRLKIPLSEAEIKIFDNLSDGIYKLMIHSDKPSDTLKLKKQSDVLTKIRAYLKATDA